MGMPIPTGTILQRQKQFLLAFETLAIQIEFGNLPYDRQPYNQFSHIANPGNVAGHPRHSRPAPRLG